MYYRINNRDFVINNLLEFMLYYRLILNCLDMDRFLIAQTLGMEQDKYDLIYILLCQGFYYVSETFITAELVEYIHLCKKYRVRRGFLSSLILFVEYYFDDIVESQIPTDLIDTSIISEDTEYDYSVDNDFLLWMMYCTNFVKAFKYLFITYIDDWAINRYDEIFMFINLSKWVYFIELESNKYFDYQNTIESKVSDSRLKNSVSLDSIEIDLDFDAKDATDFKYKGKGSKVREERDSKAREERDSRAREERDPRIKGSGSRESESIKYNVNRQRFKDGMNKLFAMGHDIVSIKDALDRKRFYLESQTGVNKTEEAKKFKVNYKYLRELKLQSESALKQYVIVDKDCFSDLKEVFTKWITQIENNKKRKAKFNEHYRTMIFDRLCKIFKDLHGVVDYTKNIISVKRKSRARMSKSEIKRNKFFDQSVYTSMYNNFLHDYYKKRTNWCYNVMSDDEITISLRRKTLLFINKRGSPGIVIFTFENDLDSERNLLSEPEQRQRISRKGKHEINIEDFLYIDPERRDPNKRTKYKNELRKGLRKNSEDGQDNPVEESNDTQRNKKRVKGKKELKDYDGQDNPVEESNDTQRNKKRVKGKKELKDHDGIDDDLGDDYGIDVDYGYEFSDSNRKYNDFSKIYRKFNELLDTDPSKEVNVDADAKSVEDTKTKGVNVELKKDIFKDIGTFKSKLFEYVDELQKKWDLKESVEKKKFHKWRLTQINDKWVDPFKVPLSYKYATANFIMDKKILNRFSRFSTTGSFEINHPIILNRILRYRFRIPPVKKRFIERSGKRSFIIRWLGKSPSHREKWFCWKSDFWNYIESRRQETTAYRDSELKRFKAISHQWFVLSKNNVFLNFIYLRIMNLLFYWIIIFFRDWKVYSTKFLSSKWFSFIIRNKFWIPFLFFKYKMVLSNSNIKSYYDWNCYKYYNFPILNSEYLISDLSDYLAEMGINYFTLDMMGTYPIEMSTFREKQLQWFLLSINFLKKSKKGYSL